jgi:hypothetical protein
MSSEGNDGFFEEFQTSPAYQIVSVPWMLYDGLTSLIDLDDEVPVITVLMTQQLTFVAGTEWDDSYWPNILASDNRDGDITDRIYIESGEGTVNFGVPGTYPVTVTVYDNWGNEGNATFNFTITAPETGCAATNASIGLLGLLGVVVFFVRRKEWL